MNVIDYELARCTYNSGNVYTEGQKLIINLTARINTTISSYDEIVRNLPAIRPNVAVVNAFNITKGTSINAIIQNGKIQLIGEDMPSVDDAIIITGECLLGT